MTKREAIEMFELYVVPGLLDQYGHDDGAAFAEAWSNFSDELHRDGEITDAQVAIWTHPLTLHTPQGIRFPNPARR